MDKKEKYNDSRRKKERIILQLPSINEVIRHRTYENYGEYFNTQTCAATKPYETLEKFIQGANIDEKIQFMFEMGIVSYLVINDLKSAPSINRIDTVDKLIDLPKERIDFNAVQELNVLFISSYDINRILPFLSASQNAASKRIIRMAANAGYKLIKVAKKEVNDGEFDQVQKFAGYIMAILEGTNIQITDGDSEIELDLADKLILLYLMNEGFPKSVRQIMERFLPLFAPNVVRASIYYLTKNKYIERLEMKANQVASNGKQMYFTLLPRGTERLQLVYKRIVESLIKNFA